MPRKSPLPEATWEIIGCRYLAGDSARALGREYGITEGAVRNRFSVRNTQIKAVANQLVTAENALRALPYSTQLTALDYANSLRTLQNNMLAGASHSSVTFVRLSSLASAMTEKVDHSKSFAENYEEYKAIAAVQRTANDAATVPTALLNANKDAAKPPAPNVPVGLDAFYGGQNPDNQGE